MYSYTNETDSDKIITKQYNSNKVYVIIISPDVIPYTIYRIYYNDAMTHSGTHWSDLE